MAAVSREMDLRSSPRSASSTSARDRSYFGDGNEVSQSTERWRLVLRLNKSFLRWGLAIAAAKLPSAISPTRLRRWLRDECIEQPTSGVSRRNSPVSRGTWMARAATNGAVRLRVRPRPGSPSLCVLRVGLLAPVVGTVAAAAASKLADGGLRGTALAPSPSRSKMGRLQRAEGNWSVVRGRRWDVIRWGVQDAGCGRGQRRRTGRGKKTERLVGCKC